LRSVLSDSILPIGIGMVFLAAAASKIVDPRSGIEAMMVGLRIDRLDAWYLMFPLVFLELILGTMLITGLQRRLALASVLFLLVAMSGFLVQLLRVGLPTGCGCFFKTRFIPSSIESELGLARNLVLMVLGTVSLRSLGRHGGRTVRPSRDVATA